MPKRNQSNASKPSKPSKPSNPSNPSKTYPSKTSKPSYPSRHVQQRPNTLQLKLKTTTVQPSQRHSSEHRKKQSVCPPNEIVISLRLSWLYGYVLSCVAIELSRTLVV